MKAEAGTLRATKRVVVAFVWISQDCPAAVFRHLDMLECSGYPSQVCGCGRKP